MKWPKRSKLNWKNFKGRTAKATMKSLGHFNGIYELESEETNQFGHANDQKTGINWVSIEWTENIYGKPAWILTNHPGKAFLCRKKRFPSLYVDDNDIESL